MRFQKYSSSSTAAFLTLAILLSRVRATTFNKPYPTNSTSTTSLLTLQPAAQTTTSHPASITSCGSNVDYWNDYLNETLLSWSISSPAKFSSVWDSVNVEIWSLKSRWVKIQAHLWTIPTMTWNSYQSSYDKSLSSYESVLWGSSQDAVLTFGSAPWTDDVCAWRTCTSQLYSISSEYSKSHPALSDFEYVASPPCCGQCTLGAKGVHLAYWPTPAPVPGVSALVDSGGFTYVSPSVYIWFSRLNAMDNCYWYGQNEYADGFTSFNPKELRTAIYAPITTQNSSIQWKPINFADFGPSCTCTPPNCPYDTLVGYDTNTCTPMLSMPQSLTDWDPDWAAEGCTVDFKGVFDPPIALTIQAGLTTPKSTPANPTSNAGSPPPPPPPTSPIAVNGPTATAPIPPPTPQPETTLAPPTVVANPSSVPPPVVVPPLSETFSPAPPNSINTPNIPPIVVVNGQTVTANSQGNFIVGTQILSTNSQGNIEVGTQTLTAGGSALTISGTTISLASGATSVPSAIVVNGQTVTANSQGNFVIGTQTISTNSQGYVLVGTQTLTAGGPAITVSGTTISLTAGAGGTPSTTHLGSIIQSFVGGSAPAQYTGKASKGVLIGCGRMMCIAAVFSAIIGLI